MASVKTRRIIVLGIAFIVLLVAVIYAFASKNSVIVSSTDGSSNEGLVLEEEFDIDEATRITFEHRMAVAEAAIDARAEVDDVDQYLILALASDADFIGDLEKARTTYEQLLQLNPINFVVWGNYANVLARMGALELADEAYWQALNLNATEAQFEKYIRFLNLHKPEGYRDRVKEMYELAITAHGQKKWIMLGLADWYLEANDCSQAVAHLQVAKQLDPEDEYIDVDIEKARDACN